MKTCEVRGDDSEEFITPIFLAGDKGFLAKWIDEYLVETSIQPIIPSKSNEDQGARFVEFDKETYQRRNIVERLFGWLKECRRILTHFEKRARHFLGMLKWAFIQKYLKTMG